MKLIIFGTYFLLATLLTCSSSRFTRLPWRIFYRSHDGMKETYIIDDNGHFSLNQSLVWCENLGGKLPVVQDQADFDFLMEEVILQSSPGGSFRTWIGRKTVFKTACSDVWMDGSLVKYPFTEVSSENCLSCVDHNCCAMFVLNDRENFGKTGHQSCESGARRVCVISEPISM